MSVQNLHQNVLCLNDNATETNVSGQQTSNLCGHRKTL